MIDNWDEIMTGTSMLADIYSYGCFLTPLELLIYHPLCFRSASATELL